MKIALRVRFAVTVAILPWLFAAILTIGVAALLEGGQPARIWFSFLFLSPHVLLPLIMFVATLVTLSALMRFAKWQSLHWAMPGVILAGASLVLVPSLGGIWAGEYGFAWSAFWMMLSGYWMWVFGVSAGMWFSFSRPMLTPLQKKLHARYSS